MKRRFDARTDDGPASADWASETQAGADRALKLLLVATVLCYAVGYPLALIGHSNVGWVFVFLGGPLLITVIALVIRRVQR